MTAYELLAPAGLDTPELRAAISPIRPEEVSVRPAPTSMMRAWGQGIKAMTLGRTVYVAPWVLAGSPPYLPRLMVHELVHTRQWAVMGKAAFTARYLSDYARGRLRGLSHSEAYHQISLEVEARQIQARLAPG